MAGCGRGTGLVDGVRLRSSLRDSAGVGRSRFPGFHPGLRSWRAYGTQSCWRVAARCGTGRHARRVTSARGGRRYLFPRLRFGLGLGDKGGADDPAGGRFLVRSGAARPGSAWGARLPGTTSLATLVRPPGGRIMRSFTPMRSFTSAGAWPALPRRRLRLVPWPGRRGRSAGAA